MTALSADEAPVWLRLESDAEVEILVRPLAATEAHGVDAGVKRASMLGYALMTERSSIGEGLCDREREASQLAWYRSLSPARQAALMEAQTYHMRRLRAWIDAAVVDVRVAGEGVPLSLGAILNGVLDADLLVAVIVEAGNLAMEASRLGKAGPLCSARLSGPRTDSPQGGPVSGAHPQSEHGGATAGAPSPTTHRQPEAPTVSGSGTSGAG